MALTASFSEVRQNLTSITDRVAHDQVEVTVFKRSKPVFRIVPVSAEERVGGSGVQAMTPVDWEDAAGSTDVREWTSEERQQLFEEAMSLRERCRASSELATWTVEDMKRELADRV